MRRLAPALALAVALPAAAEPPFAQRRGPRAMADLRLSPGRAAAAAAAGPSPDAPCGSVTRL